MDIKKLTKEEYIDYLSKKDVNNAILITENVFNKKTEENKMENVQKKDIAKEIIELAKTKFSPEEITATRSRYYSLANLLPKVKMEKAKEAEKPKKKKE